MHLVAGMKVCALDPEFLVVGLDEFSERLAAT